MSHINIPYHLYQVDGYDGLVQQFKSHFIEHQEVGASVTIYRNGEKIVNLSGGYSDFRNRIPFTNDTLVAVYSSSKVVSAMVISYLVDKGLLDYNALVTSYWPEFGQNKKDKVTLKDVLRHQGGVPWFDPVLKFEDILDRDKLKEAIERQSHVFDGEPKKCYHAVTRGFILNEIVRRVDPKGRSIGEILDEEFNKKLGTEFYYGIRDKNALLRNATWYDSSKAAWNPDEKIELPFQPLSDVPFSEMPIESKIMSVPTTRNSKSIFGGKLPEFHDVEIPSVNGHTTSESLGKLLSSMVASNSSISKATRDLAIQDALKLKDQSFGAETILTQGGFMKFEYPDINLEVYGGAGAGGSLIIFHPESGIVFSYVTNSADFNWAWYARGYDYFKAFWKDFSKKLL
jgi:CubicO group peptidase (beta-lactamase class C family)